MSLLSALVVAVMLVVVVVVAAVMLVVVALPLFAYHLVLGIQYAVLVCWHHLCDAWSIECKRVDS